MANAGSNRSWSPFDSPFGQPLRSNETGFGTSSFASSTWGGDAPPTAGAFDFGASPTFHQDSFGSPMGDGGASTHVPRDPDERFPFPGRSASSPSEFGGGASPFGSQFGCGGATLGRDPPPGFGFSGMDPRASATSMGADGVFGNGWSAFPGCGAQRQERCGSGFWYEILNYVLFIQPTWPDWDLYNQPPPQKVLEHLILSLLQHYVATFNAQATSAENVEPQPMEAEIVEIIEEEPVLETIHAMNEIDVNDEIIGYNDRNDFDEMSESEEFLFGDDSCRCSRSDVSSVSESETSSYTIENTDLPLLLFEEEQSDSTQESKSSNDIESVKASSLSGDDPPADEESIEAECEEEQESSLGDATTVSADFPVAKEKVVERNSTEVEDAIPVFELHLSDEASSCASDFSPEMLEAFFREVDISHLETRATRAIRKTGALAHFASLGLLPKPLAAQYRDQRTRLMALSLMPFNHDDTRHTQVLEDIYRLYTGNDDACVGTKGDHWGEIGFQGEDPAKELVSGGMLTLWMMLHLFNHNEERAKELLRESRKNGEASSFATMCDVATGWMIRAIRSGRLNALADEMNVISHVNSDSDSGGYVLAAQRVFVGLMYKFYHLVAADKGGIKDSARARKLTEDYLKRDAAVLLRISQVPGILYIDESAFERPTLMKKLSSAWRQRSLRRSSST